MSDKAAAKEIFESGIEAGDNRDTIIVKMVQGGTSLNSATIWYKEWAQEAGITTARVGHKAEALEYIAESGVDLLDEEARNTLKGELREEFGVAASTANDYVKAYADANGIDLPKSNFGSSPEDQKAIYDWIVANKDCTKEEFKAFMSGDMGRSSGSIDETWRGLVLARKLAADGVEFAEAA